MVCQLPVTALSFLNDKHIAAGVGRCIEVWNLPRREFVHRMSVLKNGTIHGMLKVGEHLLLCYGGQELAAVSCQTQDYGITSYTRLPDRILTIKANPGLETIMLVLAHGQVLLLSSDTLDILSRYESEQECLLYSALIFSYRGRTFVALGTVFNGVEIVEVTSHESRLMSMGRLSGNDGHKGSIFGLDYDGNYLASISDDRTVKVWDIEPILLANGHSTRVDAPIKTFAGHRSRIWNLKFCGNDFLISAGEDGTIRQWPINTGNPEVFSDHRGNIWSIAVNQNWLISGGADCSIKIRSLSNRPFMSPSEINAYPITKAEPKCLELVGIDSDPIILFSDGVLRGFDCKIPKNLINRNAVFMVIDEFSLIVGSLKGKLYVQIRERYVEIDCGFRSQVVYLNCWNVVEAEYCRIEILAQSGDGKVGWVEINSESLDVAVKNNVEINSTVICSSLRLSNSILIGSRDGKIILVQTGNDVHNLACISTEAITCLKSYDNTSILATDRGGNLSCYMFEASSRSINLQWQHRLTKGWLEQVDVVSDNTIMAAGFHGTEFFVIRLDTRTNVYTTVTGGAHRFWRLKYFVDCFIFAFLRLGKVYMVKYPVYSHGSQILKTPLHSDTIRSITRIDKNIFMTGGEDGTLKLVELSGNNPLVLETIIQHGSDVKCLASHDNIIFSGGSHEELYGWNFTFPSNLAPFFQPKPCSDDSVRIMDLDVMTLGGRNEFMLIVGYSDSFVRLFYSKANSPHIQLKAHEGHCVLCVRFISLENSLFIVSGGTDSLMVVSTLKEDQLFSLEKRKIHKSGINALAINRKKDLIATGGDDGQIVLTRFVGHDTEKLHQLDKVISAHHSTVTGVIWVDDNRFVSASIDQRVILWKYDGKLTKVGFTITQVADVGSILFHDGKIIIVGVGIELIPLENLK